MKFRKQYILTKKELHTEESWHSKKVGDFFLYTHPELEVNSRIENGTELVLIGEAFDYVHTKYSTKDILNSIKIEPFDVKDIIQQFDAYAGTYMVLCFNRINQALIAFNDASAQKEIYYLNDPEFGLVLGSQTKIISSFFEVELDQSPEAKEFFASEAFQRKRIYVGDLTEYKDVKHLRPNHTLDLNNGTVRRFYPDAILPDMNIDEAAQKAAQMIKGYLEAASERYNLLLPVSSGWESRILLAASKNFQDKCHYYVFKGHGYSDNHSDIRIPRKLASRLNFNLEVVPKNTEIDQDLVPAIESSISFPRYQNLKYIMGYWARFPDHLSVIGNVSEVARTEYPTFWGLNARKIAVLEKYTSLKYASDYYKKWLGENRPIFKKEKHRILDMLYWEENCANMVAKANTEAKMGIEFFLPFNSRALLKLLLSVKIKHREKQNALLYKKVIGILWPECLQLPINPSAIKTMVAIFQKLGIYTLYRNIRMNFTVFAIRCRDAIKNKSYS